MAVSNIGLITETSNSDATSTATVCSLKHNTHRHVIYCIHNLKLTKNVAGSQSGPTLGILCKIHGKCLSPPPSDVLTPISSSGAKWIFEVIPSCGDNGINKDNYNYTLQAMCKIIRKKKWDCINSDFLRTACVSLANEFVCHMQRTCTCTSISSFQERGTPNWWPPYILL